MAKIATSKLDSLRGRQGTLMKRLTSGDSSIKTMTDFGNTSDRFAKAFGDSIRSAGIKKRAAAPKKKKPKMTAARRDSTKRAALMKANEAAMRRVNAGI